MDLGYLMRTNKGEAVFSRDLALAATYSSQKARRNAISRIKGEFHVKFFKATLEVTGPV
jgi:hypothetical protein